MSTSGKNKSRKFIKSIQRVNGGQTLKIIFHGEEMDQSFVNSLRRTLMSEIKTYSLMAQQSVLSNTSQVFKNNEMLINRIGQIPIYIKDLDKATFLQEKLIFYICEPDEPDKPLVNNNDTDLEITSYSFQIYDTEGNLTKYKIEDLVPYDLPILKLRKGEEFHYKCEMAEGVGYYHANWKGCRVAMKYENEISLKSDHSKSKKSIITGLPLETLDNKRNYPKEQNGDPKFISLSITSVGHYEPELCFKLALETLEEKLLILRNLVENPRMLLSTQINIIHNVNIDNYIEIKIQDMEETQQFLATETLGNLLRRHMFFKLEKETKGDLSKLSKCLINYKRPHPLDRILVLVIQIAPGIWNKSDIPAIQLFYETTDNLIGYIKQLKKDFS